MVLFDKDVKLAGLNLYVSTFSGEDSIVFDLYLHNCFKRMGKEC